MEIDKSLTAKAVEVFNSIKIIDTENHALQKVILPDIDVFASPDVYVQVVDRYGRNIARSSNLGGQFLPIDLQTITSAGRKELSFKTYSYKNVRLRIYNQPIFLDAELVGILQVARTLNSSVQTLTNLRLILLTCLTLAIMAAASAGWFLARSALRPIEKVTEEAGSIGEHQDLSHRVQYNGPSDEVGRLVQTFNTMLARLQTAYEKLENSYVMQKRFLADASHELRTPLTTIRGNVELLEKIGENSSALRQECLADIRSEAERMSRLVNDLLALARAEAGQLPEKEPIALTPFLREVLRQGSLLKKEVNFIYDDPEELHGVKILGNTDYLRQLFLILLDNAFKFTPPQGTVTFSFTKEPQSVVFKIKDTGSGIAAEDLPHIFERFYRGNKARSQEGTGLGLAIAKWITEVHAADIKVSSQLGIGSTFTIKFFYIFV
ncbi:ATP-binding protein [Bacillota bacterium LX-D]|nr:ATP-binding protein [Bacillota bacterium LX-D]